ncbi:hypothetical protein OUZ56_004012 [Daphnia magna]|uniref:Uncharacterized protein n=1 Tax=Daphnia magna TaxID=35525 RepID=A0ABQ9YNH1_9CRUS|nr:hypothetical protein OUZ56_004012 [Daphnia magna]
MGLYERCYKEDDGHRVETVVYLWWIVQTNGDIETQRAFINGMGGVVFDWRHGSPWLPRGRATPAAKTAKGPTDFSELVVALRQHLSVTVQFLPIESKT